MCANSCVCPCTDMVGASERGHCTCGVCPRAVAAQLPVCPLGWFCLWGPDWASDRKVRPELGLAVGGQGSRVEEPTCQLG